MFRLALACLCSSPGRDEVEVVALAAAMRRVRFSVIAG